jgi:uncharacterized membrane protein
MPTELKEILVVRVSPLEVIQEVIERNRKKFNLYKREVSGKKIQMLKKSQGRRILYLDE